MNPLNFFKKLFRKHIKPCVKANRDLYVKIHNSKMYQPHIKHFMMQEFIALNSISHQIYNQLHEEKIK